MGGGSVLLGLLLVLLNVLTLVSVRALMALRAHMTLVAHMAFRGINSPCNVCFPIN